MSCIEIINFLAFPLIPVFLVFLLVFSPTAGWATAKIQTGKDGDELRSIREELIKSELAQLNSANVSKNEDFSTYLYSKLSHSIDYAISRHDWYEEQRGKVLQYIISLTAIVIAFSGAILGYKGSQIEDIISPLGGAATTALIIVNYSIINYNLQLDADRPYRLISDVRHWFFRYNISEKGNYADEYYSTISKANKVKTQREKFFSRIVEIDSFKKHLREDYEQLFILHVLQNYKSDSLKRLRWSLAYLVSFLSIEFIIFAINIWHV